MPEWAKAILIGIGVLILIVYVAIPIASNGACAVAGIGCRISNNLWDGGNSNGGGSIAPRRGRLAGVPPGSSARNVHYKCGNRRPRVNMNACTINADGSKHCQIDCI